MKLAEDSTPSNVLASILNPSRDLPGHYVRSEIKAGVAINASQRATVNALGHALEKIQGPPGTGKSTTIFHIITARIPRGARVLVTCSRNVAVESIAQKLERCTPDRMLVFGNASRIGEAPPPLVLSGHAASLTPY
jgi:Holliday junction resolvasome RuvABC ATP-dependent DNA helicase subunit